MFQIKQKCCEGTKNVLLWYITVITVLNCRVCLVWPYVALYGLMWPCMPLNGLVWPYVASYVLDVTFHGHDYYYVWPHLN